MGKCSFASGRIRSKRILCPGKGSSPYENGKDMAHLGSNWRMLKFRVRCTTFVGVSWALPGGLVPDKPHAPSPTCRLGTFRNEKATLCNAPPHRAENACFACF